MHTSSKINTCNVVVAIVSSFAILGATQEVGATIILTAGAGGANLTSVGLDTTTGPAGLSVAPVFPSEFKLVTGSKLSVASSSDLGANYIGAYLNDDTGFSYLVDNASNRGWIPSSVGVETATLTFNTPNIDIGLSGIDFLTLFNNRTAGSFVFEYSTNNQSTWTQIFTLTNDVNSELFRQGVTFDPIFGVTDVRLITDATGSQLFIGEIDLYTVAAPIPEPSAVFLLTLGIPVVLGARRRRALA